MKLFSGFVLLSAAPLLTLGLLAPAEEGKIYECTDAKGQVVYQDEPCLEPVPVATTHQAAPTSPPVLKPRRVTPPPGLPGGPIDARWATPEKTLKTFVGAVTAGDRALVLSCLTSSALADLGLVENELPLAKLRETVGSFTGYVTEGDLGPLWSIRALRKGMRPKWIFFERMATGEWKIAGI